MEILHLVDIIEGYNGHTVFDSDNRKGLTFAQEHSVATVASSDAHTALELGRTYTEIREEDWDHTPQGLMNSVNHGRLVGRRTKSIFLAAPSFARLRKVLS